MLDTNYKHLRGSKLQAYLVVYVKYYLKFRTPQMLRICTVFLAGDFFQQRLEINF